MCLTPVYIKNPRFKNHTFLRGVDPETLAVPCGHCAQCRQQKINEFTFRSYNEYLSTLKKGGFTIFETFTYSDVFVPLYAGFRFFNKKDVTDFLKRLRISLTRANYHVTGNFKYIISSEFGGTTYRPHLHALFFVTIPGLTAYQFNRFVRKAWSRKDYSFGFTDRKKVEDRIIGSIYGLRYVCKYITKDDNVVNALKYSSHSQFVEFMYDLAKNDGLNLYDLKMFQLREYFSTFKEVFPDTEDLTIFNPMYISKGLGLSFLENIEYDDLFNEQIVPVTTRKLQMKFQVPSYYIRKLFYDYNKSTKRYVLNDIGRQYFIDYKNKYITEKYESLTFLKEQYKGINFDTPKFRQYGIKSFDDVLTYIDKQLAGRSLSHFVKYMVLCHGRAIDPSLQVIIPDLEEFSQETVEVISQHYSDCYYNDKTSWIPNIASVYRKYGTHLFSHEPNQPYVYWHELPVFKDYHRLVGFINLVMSCLNRGKQKAYDMQQKEFNDKASVKKAFDRSTYIIY